MHPVCLGGACLASDTRHCISQENPLVTFQCPAIWLWFHEKCHKSCPGQKNNPQHQDRPACRPPGKRRPIPPQSGAPGLHSSPSRADPARRPSTRSTPGQTGEQPDCLAISMVLFLYLIDWEVTCENRKGNEQGNNEFVYLQLKDRQSITVLL